ncbi:MAG: CoA transferase [Chloroflexi bacterium]|nr:CoA transferase [Chloroflexota bacterium]
MSVKALAGVRVVEFSRRVSVSCCAKVLADFGAEIIKVETPGSGDPARQHGPFPGDRPDPEKSGLFLTLNTNKKGVTLDARSPKGRELLTQLLRKADVFVYDLTPAEADALGLTHADLNAENPGLVCTLITPYGATGPYKDFQGADLSVNAAGGITHGVGFLNREPLCLPLFQVSYMAGLTAAIATTMAVLYRGAGGEGQLVDISESDVLAVLIDGIHLPTYVYRGTSGHRNGRRARMGRFPNTVIECKDGWVCLHVPQLEQYLRFFKMIGEPEWGKNPRYRDRRAMAEEYPDEAEALLAPWFKSHTKQEVLEQLMAYHVPGSPVLTTDDIFHSTHLRERGFFSVLTHPNAGALEYPTPPYRMSDTPTELVQPAPTLGQHNAQVFVDLLGLAPDDLKRLAADGVV